MKGIESLLAIQSDVIGQTEQLEMDIVDICDVTNTVGRRLMCFVNEAHEAHLGRLDS